MKNYIYAIIIIISFYSCGYTTYGYNSAKQIGSNLYMSGYWGEWKNSYSMKIHQNSDNTFPTITIYSNSHPSDFDIQIQTTSLPERKDKWYYYKGKVNVKCFNEWFDKLGDYYNQKVNLNNKGDKKIAFACEILSSYPINEVVKKKGTINVFYNGVGRGYSFKNY